MYRSRVSGPLMDRLDLQVTVPPVAARSLSSGAAEGVPSENLRERVLGARSAERARGILNAEMTLRDLDRHAALDREGEAFLRRATERWKFSARAHVRVRRLARTIADLDESPAVRVEHLREAVAYRIQREG
jgi:magnesium chelatase family protein